MTTLQDAHAHGINHRGNTEALSKYSEGQKSHGGNLWEKGLLFHAKNAREEAIDQLAYTDGLMQDLPKLREKLKQVFDRIAIPGTWKDNKLVTLLEEMQVLLDGKPNT